VRKCCVPTLSNRPNTHGHTTTAKEKVVTKCCVTTLSNCPNTHGHTTTKEKVVRKCCVPTLSNCPNTHGHTTPYENIVSKCCVTTLHIVQNTHGDTKHKRKSCVPTSSIVLVGNKKTKLFTQNGPENTPHVHVVVPQCGGGPYT